MNLVRGWEVFVIMHRHFEGDEEKTSDDGIEFHSILLWVVTISLEDVVIAKVCKVVREYDFLFSIREDAVGEALSIGGNVSTEVFLKKSVLAFKGLFDEGKVFF